MAGVTFTGQELGRLWLDHGGKVADAATAAAIALAYSGGCRFAKSGPVDDRPVKTCTYTFTRGVNRYGLWGINPEHHPGFSPAELYTAEGNVRAALEAVGAGSDFSAFPEFNSGEFGQHVPAGISPTPRPAPTGSGIGAQSGGTVTTRPPASSGPAGIGAEAGAKVTLAPIGGNVLSAWGGFTRELAHGLPAQLTRSRNYRAGLAGQIRRMARP